MAKVVGFAAVFKITVTAVLTLVAQIEEMEFPSVEKVLAESMTYDATWKEFFDTGMREAKSFKLTISWDKAAATHIAIQAAFAATASVNMSVENNAAAPQKETITFAGHIVSMSRTVEKDNLYMCELEIQPTGAITIA